MGWESAIRMNMPHTSRIIISLHVLAAATALYINFFDLNLNAFLNILKFQHS